MMRWFSLSRNQLKWLALFCMVLDHAACAFLPETSVMYLVFRFVFGRMAYPIFCVLFVEGFLYTRHPGRHIRDLLLFGVLSEPFFDMALYHSWWYPQHQNVMFSWSLGFVLLWLLEQAYRKYLASSASFASLYFAGVLVFGVLAGMLHLDYDFVGIFCVAIAYLIKRGYQLSSVWMAVGAAGMDALCSATPGVLLAILPFTVYDPEKQVVRGRHWKYWFYAAYPLHLAVFAVLVCVIS